ncbi:MAG TPA: glycosyltransferase, partial [Candidatus Deferrimicrobium sp.]|nr:glycosyltransferase [Candidatus Deferrimicrobium sp.]
MFCPRNVFGTITAMVERIRLLILTHNYPRFKGDFAGVFISLLARRLTEFDVDPIVLTPHDAQAAEFEQVDGVAIYRFRYADTPDDEDLAYRGNMQQRVLGSLSGLIKFRRLLHSYTKAALDVIGREKPHVIAGHWLIPAGMVMKRLARSVRLPMILSSHGTDIRLIRHFGGMPYRYFKPLTHQLKRWTVVSGFLKEQILSLDSRLKDLIEVLPLPHDESTFYKDDSIPRDSDLVVAVTRFTKQKRVDHLIRAFAKVVERRPQARLEIYGSGPLQAEIERLVDSLSLRSRVTIIPPVAQQMLRAAYNRAAVVVLNSYQEGFGLALSEAMMCGAAVVGADSGGIPDIVRHGETGLLVSVDNTDSLSLAMT